jgi:hypothetical protein
MILANHEFSLLTARIFIAVGALASLSLCGRADQLPLSDDAVNRLIQLVERHGYHESISFTANSTALHRVQDVLRSSKASTWNEFQSESSSWGLKIPLIDEISLGLSQSDANSKAAFSNWKSKILAATNREMAESESLAIVVRTINTEVVKTLAKAIRQQKGLVGWLSPASQVDGSLVSLYLKHVPATDAPAILTADLSVVATAGDASIDPASVHLLRKGSKVPVAGVNLVIRRDPHATVVATINTTAGSKTLMLPGSPVPSQAAPKIAYAKHHLVIGNAGPSPATIVVPEGASTHVIPSSSFSGVDGKRAIAAWVTVSGPIAEVSEGYHELYATVNKEGLVCIHTNAKPFNRHLMIGVDVHVLFE